MTEDYKELLGKYITGNITPGTPDNSPNFTSLISKTQYNTSGIIPPYPKLLSYNICNMLGLTQNSTTYFHIVAKDLLTTNTTDNMVLYGSVYQYDYSALTDTYIQEFIAVLDNNYFPLAVFSSNDNSIITNKLCKLAYDEEGNIYGIDNQGTNASPVYRFLMLNNIAVKNEQGNYEVNLRKTYYFPNTMNTFNPTNLIFKKSPEEAIYFILGKNTAGTKLITTILKIEVGSSNEWKQFNYTLSSTISDFEGIDMLLTQSGDDNTAYIISLATSELLVCDVDSGMSGATITTQCTIPKSVVIVAPTRFFYTDYASSNCIIREYYNGEENDIFTFGYSGTANTDTLGFLKYVNGLLFWVRSYLDGADTYLAYGCYNGSLTNEIRVAGEILEAQISIPFNITSNFGLYVPCICYTPVITVSPGTTIPTSYAVDTIYLGILLNYTSLYSGTQYENYNALIPTTARVYGSKYTGIVTEKNNIFSRQLYNSTTINSTTTSTVEVPNTFLNDVYLKKMSLFGASSYDLTDNLLNVGNYITKNIYEALYINFMNTINVIDSDTQTKYQTTANNITSNINNSENNNGGTLMNNKKIANLQINWQNDTPTITGIGIIQNDTTNYTITATIYIDRPVETIDINSSDNSQTYITLDNLDLEVGKYYTLTQELEIE